MSRIKVKPGVGEGHYDLYIGDEKVGETIKKVEHYNIHPKPVTSISWVLRIHGVRGSWRTRRDALAYAETILFNPDGTRTEGT